METKHVTIAARIDTADYVELQEVVRITQATHPKYRMSDLVREIIAEWATRQIDPIWHPSMQERNQ